MSTEFEEWRAIADWEGFYEVSDHGRVRSLDRTIEFARGGKTILRRCLGRIMSPAMHTHGYAQVGLRRDGEQHTRLVHALVLEAFVGPPPEGMEGCHEENDKWHNRLSNLRYDTHKVNCEDRVRQGAQPRGETCAHAVLTDADVVKIRRLHGRIKNTEIAEQFGITPSNVGYIVKNKTWRHLLPENSYASR